jgi:uncharacterized OB-fold protein
MILPVPVIDDHDTKGFFAAAQRGAIAVLRCAACEAVVHLPLPRCPRCSSLSLDWHDVRPTGRIHSFTRVVHPTHPAFEVPYTVVLIELDDEPTVRLLGHLPGTPEVQIGQNVEATFDDVRGEVVVPQWRPAPGPVTSEVSC